jgi:arsenate reductase (glutaredoxin)
MNKVTMWHNPRCSKSREALSLLEQYECEKDIIKYLETSPDKEQIRVLLKMLQITPRELMRTKEDIYKELALKNEEDEEKLIDAMVLHPKLIERPILIKGDKAIIARPPSLVEDFLKS